MDAQRILTKLNAKLIKLVYNRCSGVCGINENGEFDVVLCLEEVLKEQEDYIETLKTSIKLVHRMAEKGLFRGGDSAAALAKIAELTAPLEKKMNGVSYENKRLDNSSN